MVGNDIVDIAKAKKDSNWQRPRFLDKLFTTKEQQGIHNSSNPFIMVWKLWSMKEAAYKLYTQINPSRFYKPKKFECTIEENKDIVLFQDFKCYVVSKITADYIISEATLKPLSMTSEVIEFKTISETHSSYLKKKLLSSMSLQYNISEDELGLNKDVYGIPTITYNETKIHISLTHHGNYGAFAIV